MTTPEDFPINKDEAKWHLDKRVPIALIVAILVQCGTGIWWGATMAARVDSNERRIVQLEANSQKMADSFTTMNAQMSRLDERIMATLETTRRIETMLEMRSKR